MTQYVLQQSNFWWKSEFLVSYFKKSTRGPSFGTPAVDMGTILRLVTDQWDSVSFQDITRTEGRTLWCNARNRPQKANTGMDDDDDDILKKLTKCVIITMHVQATGNYL